MECQKTSTTQEYEFNITTPDLSIPNHVVIFQWIPKPACCFFPQICIFNISSVAHTTYKRVQKSFSQFMWLNWYSFQDCKQEFQKSQKEPLILLNSSISGSLDLLHPDGPYDGFVATWDGIIPCLSQPVFITPLEPNISHVRQQDMLLL